MTDAVLFENAAILDGSADGAVPGHVLVEAGMVKEVSDTPIAAAGARRVDLRGRTLMPGLIDAHVHVVAGVVNLGLNAMLPDAKGANCEGVLSVQLVPGTSADRVSIAQFTLLDVKRVISAAAIDGAAAAADQHSMPTGSTPKL
jgi:predicted amidohydrolase